jgi:cyclophilin family peptidyl-prolyl cis-trans isomerase
MRRTRSDLMVLTLLAALGGCGKSEDSAATATTAAPTSQSPGDAVATNSPGRSPSGVVPATATQPVVQADPIVVFYTSVGEFYVRLYEKQAPRTVANFLHYLRGGFYDGTIFHQVEPGFVAMGGGYDQRKQPKPTRYAIPNEAANGLKNVRGSLAMARDPQKPQSASSEFFFNLADNAKLDHRGTAADEFGYCVFGQVIDGLDVLDKLSSAAGQTVVINTVKVLVMPRDDQVKPASNQSSQTTPNSEDLQSVQYVGPGR